MVTLKSPLKVLTKILCYCSFIRLQVGSILLLMANSLFVRTVLLFNQPLYWPLYSHPSWLKRIGPPTTNMMGSGIWTSHSIQSNFATWLWEDKGQYKDQLNSIFVVRATLLFVFERENLPPCWQPLIGSQQKAFRVGSGTYNILPCVVCFSRLQKKN